MAKIVKANQVGFVLLWVVLGIMSILAVCCFAFYRIVYPNLNFFGPKIPALSSYKAIDRTAISNSSRMTKSELAENMRAFGAANSGLLPVGNELFDGCGLFVTKSNGDFAAAYGKVCSQYVQGYYVSTDSSRITLDDIDRWLANNTETRISQSVTPTQQCINKSIDRDGNLSNIAVYSLDSSLANLDAQNCAELSKIDTTQPALSAPVLLMGAVGANDSYQEVRAQSSVNRKNLLETARAKGYKTIVIMQWSKTYYSHTF